MPYADSGMVSRLHTKVWTVPTGQTLPRVGSMIAGVQTSRAARFTGDAWAAEAAAKRRVANLAREANMAKRE